ncbi:hypothetical protein LCGC14_1437370 [marine sediment metagenome]|uniref:Uncharacterized protein n=1 Tax=marine sediment metagenome TaxID=412755 RepID=A0A0F9M2B0_9ZZZZ
MRSEQKIKDYINSKITMETDDYLEVAVELLLDMRRTLLEIKDKMEGIKNDNNPR